MIEHAIALFFRGWPFNFWLAWSVLGGVLIAWILLRITFGAGVILARVWLLTLVIACVGACVLTAVRTLVGWFLTCVACVLAVLITSVRPAAVVFPVGLVRVPTVLILVPRGLIGLGLRLRLFALVPTVFTATVGLFLL